MTPMHNNSLLLRDWWHKSFHRACINGIPFLWNNSPCWPFFGMQGFPLTDARARESVSTLESTGPNYRTPVFVDCTEVPNGLRRLGVLWFQAEEDLSWPWLPCEEQGLAGSSHAQIRASSLGLRPGKPPSPGSTSSPVCGWSWKET